MRSLKERFAALRERYPWLDHVVTMLGHYGAVNGNGQAGAVTYFGFLSVFPILALAVSVVGVVAQVYPDIRGQMSTELNNLLPGLIGPGKNEVNLDDLGGSVSSVAGVIGLAGVLYSGLGWLSGLRQALEVMFVIPRRQQPNLLIGKLRDLRTLAVLGLVLMLSVVLSSAVTGFSGVILGWLGIDEKALLPRIGLSVLGHLLGIAASTVLLMAMFRLLAEARVPRSALVRGAVLGAVLFEILKSAASLLLASTKNQPAFQTFGVALILVVWINYFSRFVMYAAAWAYTSPVSLERRTAGAMRAPGAALGDDDAPAPAPAPASAPAPVARPGGTATVGRPRPWLVTAGAVAAGALAGWLARGDRS